MTKLVSAVLKVFDEDGDFFIDKNDFDDDDNGTLFMHALSNLVPHFLYEQLTGDKVDALEFNHIANKLCFKYGQKVIDERTEQCVKAFEGIDDPLIWMKSNQEHVDGLLKGVGQNAKVAIACGEQILKLESLFFRVMSAIKNSNTGMLADQVERWQIEANTILGNNAG